jgi:hypothetical protein
MVYKLYFKNFFIATVEHVYSDFPSLSGYYQLVDFGDADRETKMIREYISHSIESARYYENNEAHKKRADELAKDDWKYVELLEGNEWHLESENGETIPILTPLFGDNQEIGWRYT